MKDLEQEFLSGIARIREEISQVSKKAEETKYSGAIQPLIFELLRTCHHALNIGVVNESGEGEDFIVKQLGAKAPDNAFVFDVGANVGNYSQIILDNFPPNARLHCFEPSVKAHSALRAKMSSQPNVSIHKLAVSDAAGDAVLHYDVEGSGLASLHERQLSHHGINFGASETVSTVKIDDFCKANGIDRIYLLKLDTEGNEIKALLGAREMIANNKIDFIQFEFGCNIDSRTYLRDFFTILSQSFVICRILKSEVAPLAVYDEIYEIFQYSNFLACSKNIVSSDLKLP